MSERSLPRLLVILLLTAMLTACGAERAALPSRVYVAIGASDSVGVGARKPETEGWVPRLQATMPEGTQLVNLGVSGAVFSEALDQQLPVALDAQPTVVTVWLAVNDLKNGVSLRRYERDLNLLLMELKSTGATVLVGNMPDLTSLPLSDAVLQAYGTPSRVALHAEIARWNASIARIASRHGAIIVDLHAGWRELRTHPEYLSGDGFHPSSQGYARLAQVWRARLQSTPR
ncbi:MAG: SGNH/GDSL hydrolase family protein [Chloroflexia bacterium]|nr:SGNH/GDSL hydrolase family protein [Chloroflexia bacterium]